MIRFNRSIFNFLGFLEEVDNGLLLRIILGVSTGDIADVLLLSFLFKCDTGVQPEIFKPAVLSFDFFFFFLLCLLLCGVSVCESFNFTGLMCLSFLNGNSVFLEQTEHLMTNLFISFFIDFCTRVARTFGIFWSGFSFMHRTIFFTDLDTLLPLNIRTWWPTVFQSDPQCEHVTKGPKFCCGSAIILLRFLHFCLKTF